VPHPPPPPPPPAPPAATAAATHSRSYCQSTTDFVVSIFNGFQWVWLLIVLIVVESPFVVVLFSHFYFYLFATFVCLFVSNAGTCRRPKQSLVPRSGGWGTPLAVGARQARATCSQESTQCTCLATAPCETHIASLCKSRLILSL
jgi:hypothetical protein